MKKILLALVLGTATLMNAQVIGIRIGPPPPPRVVRRPRMPGPGYVWVDGYWYAANNRYAWHGGYWTRAPYEGASWVGPRYEGGMFYAGYWNGPRGRMEHDHAWDHDRHVRDYRH
ncbi:MAG TPA: YXWGXW repeat-containing protein [Bryobacteraceae bacterium]|jgi:hypothetical protein